MNEVYKKLSLLVVCLLIAGNSSFAATKPALELSKTSLAFGKVLRANSKTLLFSIKSKDEVTLKADKLWIELDKSSAKSPSTVKVTIKASLLPIGTDYAGQIKITSKNHQDSMVKISVSTEKTLELKMKINAKTASVNGRTVQVKTPLFMKGCTPLVPLRFVADIFGATTIYDPKDMTITIFRLDRVIEVLPDIETITVNGKEMITNPAPKSYNGTFFVPLGFFNEAFGLCIDWDRTGQNGTIKYCN